MRYTIKSHYKFFVLSFVQSVITNLWSGGDTSADAEKPRRKTRVEIGCTLVRTACFKLRGTDWFLLFIHSSFKKRHNVITCGCFFLLSSLPFLYFPCFHSSRFLLPSSIPPYLSPNQIKITYQRMCRSQWSVTLRNVLSSVARILELVFESSSVVGCNSNYTYMDIVSIFLRIM